MFIILIIIFTGCSKNPVLNETDTSLTDIPLANISLADTSLTNIFLTDIPLSNISKRIYLYGEQHGVKKYWIKSSNYGMNIITIKT